jgi:hypothetical protein
VVESIDKSSEIQIKAVEEVKSVSRIITGQQVQEILAFEPNLPKTTTS